MVTVPDRLLSLPGVRILHESAGLLLIEKTLPEPLYERQSFLRMHALVTVLTGRQEVEYDDGPTQTIRAGDTRLLPRGLYTVSDLLPPRGGTFRVRILYFDEQVLRTPATDPGRRLLIEEIRAAVEPDALLAPRRLDPLSFLERHFDKPLTLADFALLTGSSVSTFQRVFRRRTGRAPRQWIIDRRLDRAQQLRANGEHGTRALARAVGYTSTSHFIRQYKQRFGHTPGDNLTE